MIPSHAVAIDGSGTETTDLRLSVYILYIYYVLQPLIHK